MNMSELTLAVSPPPHTREEQVVEEEPPNTEAFDLSRWRLPVSFVAPGNNI
jgi:hypothetical protein